MASCVGNWKIEKSDNFEEYMKAIGVSDDKRADAHKYLSAGSNMAQKFSVSDKDWTLKTTTVMGEREVKFTEGQPFDNVTLDGRPIKVTFTVDGDKLVEKQAGENFDCTHERVGTDSILTMTLTGNGVTCIRTFTKV